jgi:hypothetical protein
MNIRVSAKRTLLIVAALAFAPLFSASFPAGLDAIKIPISLRVDSAAFSYDGKEHAITAFRVDYAPDAYRDGLRVVWDFRIALTDVGSVSTNAAMEESIKVYHSSVNITDYVRLRVAHGTLSIQPAPVTIRAEESYLPYNGALQKAVLGFSPPEGLAPGDYVAANFQAFGKDAGYYAVSRSVNPVSIYSQSRGKDVTGDYDISVVGGLAILPVVRYIYKGDVPSGAEPLPPPQAVSAGKSYAIAPAPKANGYSFSGWKTGSALASGGSFTVPPGVNEIAFAGSFSRVPSSHSLNFYVDGDLYRSVPYREGDAIKAIQEPSREGSKFSGWSSLPGAMPGYDVSVQGSFSKELHTVAYFMNGELFATQRYAGGSPIVPPDLDGVDGFAGWESLPEAMPEKDVAVYARVSSEAQGQGPSGGDAEGGLGGLSGAAAPERPFLLLSAALSCGGVLLGASAAFRGVQLKKYARACASGLIALLALAFGARSIGGGGEVLALPLGAFLACQALLSLSLFRFRKAGGEGAGGAGPPPKDDEDDADRLRTGEYEVIRPGELREGKDRTAY